MSHWNGLTIEIDGNAIEVRGFKAGNRVKAFGAKARYSTPLGAWMLDARHLPDFLAWLDSRNIWHTVVDPRQGQLELGGDRP